MTKPLKFGYEGEGPMLGRRTVYASYPGASVQEVADKANSCHVDSIYFVVDSNHQDFVSALLAANLGSVKAVTLDFGVAFYHFFERLIFAVRFIRCDVSTPAGDVPTLAAGIPFTYIKMVCEESYLFAPFVHKANEIATMGHTVLLMPDFWTDKPEDLGSTMMGVFDHLHPRVRLMPPVHHVLRMP